MNRRLTMEKIILTVVLLAHIAMMPACFSSANSTQSEIEFRASITVPALTKGCDVTFVFDKKYQCGKYASGDWWVAVDHSSKTVVLQAITPVGKKGRNGWCVNPENMKQQPYDNRARLAFDASQTPVLPYVAHGGESIVKAVSAAKRLRHSYIQFAAVLTVVAQPLKHSSSIFRPPYAGKNKPTFSTENLQLKLLPALKPTPHAISRTTAERKVFGTRLDYSSSWASSDIAPIDSRTSWGAEMGRSDCEALLWLSLDIPVKDKMKTLIGMVQYGIDLYGARKSLGTEWVHGGGGNGQGRALPFSFAALMLNSPELKAELKKSITTKPYGNTFWETEMFYRCKQNNMVLWGKKAPWDKYDTYWKSLSVNPNLNKAGIDPYGWIDGGSIPGQQYQGCVSLPVKYTALVLHLIPQLKPVWPEKDIRIIEYADRWVSKGVHTLPDPIAPPVKLTNVQWINRVKFGYGKTWGPDPKHPDDAIRGKGRYPAVLNGSYPDSAKLGGIARRSLFGDAMWKAYRHILKP